MTEEAEEDSVAYILKERQTEEDNVIYEMVEDEGEMKALSNDLAEMLEGVECE